MSGEKTAGIEALSHRQREILRLISQHLQAKEVARVLKISEHTVKTHTEEARKRLGVATSREAARLLAAYETETGGLPPVYRPLPMGIPDAPDDMSTSGHEHALPSEAPTFHPVPERSGNAPAETLRPWQVLPDPQYSGQGMADGRWTRFRRRLNTLTTIQWIGFILAVALGSAFLAGALIAALLGSIEIIQQITHYAGW